MKTPRLILAALTAASLYGCTVVQRVSHQSSVVVRETTLVGLQRQPVECEPLVLPEYKRPELSFTSTSLSWRATVSQLAAHAQNLNRAQAAWEDTVRDAVREHNLRCGLLN